MSSISECPICLSRLDDVVCEKQDGYTYKCSKCGSVKLDSASVGVLKKGNYFTPRQRANFQFWIHKNNHRELCLDDFESLKSVPTAALHERAMVLLRECSKLYPDPGQEIELDWGQIRTDTTSLLKGISGSVHDEEFHYIVHTYLCKELRFLEYDQGEAWITPKGWAALGEETNKESNLGFVAMSFAEEWNDLYDQVIEKGIFDAGYEPTIMRKHHHNENICDEMIALIRKSRFLVADYSASNQGAYYEAGFAYGLGIRVINLCREDKFEDLHFDRAQINHIPWSEDDFPAARKALKDRIEATIGRGPLRQEKGGI